MKDFFKNLTLKARVTFVISLVLIFMLSVFALIVYLNRKKTLSASAEVVLNNNLKNASLLFDYSIENQKRTAGIVKQNVQSVINTINADSMIVQFDTASIVLNQSKNEKAKLLIQESDILFYKEWFKNIDIFDNGYLFLTSKDGFVYFLPDFENKNISDKKLFKSMLKKDKGNLKLKWPEDESGKQAWIFYQYYEPYQCYIVALAFKEDYLDKPIRKVMILALFSMLVALLLFYVTIHYLTKSFTVPIYCINNQIKNLENGNLETICTVHRNDELGRIADNLNKLTKSLKLTALFAKEIEKRNFDFQFTPTSNEDELGNALVDMKQSLQHAAIEEEKRKLEDEKRNWSTLGIAKFSEILRKNNSDLEQLTFEIISNLVAYLDANQGGVFVLNDDDPSNKFLQMSACYAYDRQKFLEKKVLIGEGLVGTCFQEKKTIHIHEIPDNYITITSGLGASNPKTVLLVPLKVNEEIFGIVEIASFKSFEPHEVEFVEKIGESIASTISSVKINARTAFLLEQSQLQAEEMKAQEEEMRQNMEEMHATQEELARKNSDMVDQEQEIKKQMQQLVERQYEYESQEQEYKQRIIDLSNEIDRLKELHGNKETE